MTTKLAILYLIVVFSERGLSEDFPKFESGAKGFFSYRDTQVFENLATTVPYSKKQIDLNELELYGAYELSNRSEVEFEIEIEHGGAGTALEYDAFEEFGEFESEVEKGGEVVLSEFYFDRELTETTWLKVGKFPLGISLGNVLENYSSYPTVQSSLAEAFMLPTSWREVGFAVQKKLEPYELNFAIVNGLNSEFFRKYSWIGGGYQNQFEQSNANSAALFGSFVYGDLKAGQGIGLAVYHGDTSSNRHKRSKLQTEAKITLLSFMASYVWRNLHLRGQFINGELENSDLITEANSSLGNLANPGSFAALGHKAQLQQVELSYDLKSDENERLQVFAGLEKVDTMKEVEGSIVRDDRYNVLISSIGMSWRFDKAIFMKAQYNRFSTALEGLPDTNMYQLAFGFDLENFNQE